MDSPPISNSPTGTIAPSTVVSPSGTNFAVAHRTLSERVVSDRRYWSSSFLSQCLAPLFSCFRTTTAGTRHTQLSVAAPSYVESAMLHPPPSPDSRKSLHTWAAKAYESLRTEGEVEKFLQYQRDHPDELTFEEASQHVKKYCSKFAYHDIYIREIGRPPAPFDDKGKENFLHELNKIANPTVAVTMQGFSGKEHVQPDQALAQDKSKAFRHNLYIIPRDYLSRSEKDATLSIYPRMALGIKPEHIIAVASHVASAFGGEFDNMLYAVKVLSANEQGVTADNLVVYLSQATPARAKQFADHLRSVIPVDAWEKCVPLGMHPMYQDIALGYGEIAGNANTTSFGTSRADIIAAAIVRHLTDSLPLTEAVDVEVERHGYSVADPAFVKRDRISAN